MATSDDKPAKPKTTRAQQAAAKPRAGRGRFVKSADTAERDAQACRMRTQGHTYDEISAALGFADRAGSRRAVERALLAVVQEPAAELLTLELTRLDKLLAKAWAVLESEHIVVSNGRVVFDPRTEQPLRDHGPILAAIDRSLSVGVHRAKLLGLFAPIKVQDVPLETIEAEIDRLARELGMNDPAPADQ